MKFFITAFMLIISLNCFSYPKFIGHGYNSCLTCHYNSQGNGPLSDYGRALGATEISGKTFRAEKSDDEIGKSSNFLWMKKPLPWGIRPSINYRGMLFSEGVGNNDVVQDMWTDAQYINMQISANVAIKIDEKEKYTLVGEVSYNPDDRNDEDNSFRSREYYFRWMPTKSFITYLGLMDKVFGIRFENHYLFSRSLSGLMQNDQSHGVTLVYQTDSWEITGQYFLGNVHIEKDTEQAGVNAKLVYKANSFNRWGASFLTSSSPYIEKTMMSAHIEHGLGHGTSILGEFGVINQLPKTGGEIGSRYLHLQGTLRPTRGLYLYQVFEYVNNNTQNTSYSMRVGPGVQWFVDQGLEFRFDLLNQRAFSDGNPTTDEWEFLSQVHVWL